MSQGQHVALLAQIELTRRFRAGRTRIALTLFCAVLAFGAWSYWHALPPRPQDDRLFGYAYLIAMMVSLQLSFARDRRSHFDAFLVSNFVSARDTYFSKLVAALIYLGAAGAATFAIALGISLGDVEYSSWYSILFCLVGLLFLPLVVLVELLLDLDYPVPVVALLFTAAISIVNRTGDAKRALRAFGLDVGRYDYSDLRALALRVIVALLFAAALYPVYLWRLDHRRRGGLQA